MRKSMILYDFADKRSGKGVAVTVAGRDSVHWDKKTSLLPGDVIFRVLMKPGLSH
jgi:hypothetical protein